MYFFWLLRMLPNDMALNIKWIKLKFYSSSRKKTNFRLSNENVTSFRLLPKCQNIPLLNVWLTIFQNVSFVHTHSSSWIWNAEYPIFLSIVLPLHSFARSIECDTTNRVRHLFTLESSAFSFFRCNVIVSVCFHFIRIGLAMIVCVQARTFVAYIIFIVYIYLKWRHETDRPADRTR